MARHWTRIVSIAAALGVIIFLLGSVNVLRSDTPGLNLLDGGVLEEHHDEGQPSETPSAEQPSAVPPEMQAEEPTIVVPDGMPLETQPESPPIAAPDAPQYAGKPPDINDLLGLGQHVSASTESAATPSPTAFSKVVVMGKLQAQDTDWVGQALSDWQNAIYVVDVPDNATSPTGLRTKINKSKEAMPYLTYIIDNYPNFPDVMVFIHAHRNGYPEAWHTDARNNDAVNMLHDLRLNVVVERGYVNLRCTESPGCPDEIRPWRNPPDMEKLPEQIYPYVYADFFNLPLSEVRKQVEVVATPCCAQFAVSREQMLKKPKEEYERYRAYLEETTYDDDTIGRVLEYMWHIIFGRDAVHCRNPAKCWCEVYGRCARHWHGPGSG